MVEWASGLLCRHSGDILRIIGISYWKNVGTNADMAGQRPTPPSARKLSGIGILALFLALVSPAPAEDTARWRLQYFYDQERAEFNITDLLHEANVKVTRLAHGVPVGGELDYLDEGTLAGATGGRAAAPSILRPRGGRAG